MKYFRFVFCAWCAFIVFLYPCPNALPNGFMDAFYDPSDGNFDVSNWLLERRGFLPVPIIVTEPAVGFGAGVGLLFFHESVGDRIKEMEKDKAKQDGKPTRLAPPSISGVAAMKTENGTWAAGGGYFGVFKHDQVRYTITGGKASVNMKFYGTNEDSILKNGVNYNLDGWGFDQKLKFRLDESDVFLGGELIYYEANSQFDFNNLPGDVNQWEIAFKNVGAGLLLDYDSRDNIFTPSDGVLAEVSALYYKGEGLLSKSRNYQIIDAGVKYFREIIPGTVLGWRIRGGFSMGDVPFYALPHIQLRGVANRRYQAKNVLDTEIEARYQVTDRWSLVPFAGVGAAATDIDEFKDSKPRWAGGIGIRYLIAQKLRMHYGIDMAKSEDDWAIYFTLGTGL